MPDLRTTALRLLARREHAQYELSVKLETRGFLRDDIKTLITTLAAQGLQSDARFAQQYVQVRFEKGYGENWIKQALSARRLPEALIEDVLSTYSPTKWIERARAVLLKRFGQVELHGCDFEQRCQYIQFLQYRGFSFDQAQAVLSAQDTPSFCKT